MNFKLSGVLQGDIFGGLNDGLLSRAEALAAVDISKHQSGPQPGPPLPQLKHDVVYHHGVGGPPSHNARPHQVHLFSDRFVNGCEEIDRRTIQIKD